MIALLTASALFQIIMQTSGAVLMGMGRMKALMAGVGVGIAVKVIGSVLLSPWLGIYGIIASTGLCFIVMSWINISVLKKSVSFTVLGRRFGGLIASVAVIVVLGFLFEWLTHSYVNPFEMYRINQGINSVLVCTFVIVLYPLLLMATKVVTKEDVKSFPAPLQKLIAKVSRIVKRG
jgi:stage V sporulation protein B